MLKYWCECSGYVGYETDMGGVASLECKQNGVRDKLNITDATMVEAFKIIAQRGTRYYRFWDAVGPQPVYGVLRTLLYNLQDLFMYHGICLCRGYEE